MADSLKLSVDVGASPATIYRAWLSSEEHTAMTGGGATTSAEVGAPLSAWDGYISGKNLALEPNERIVQAWRTTEFPASAPDSRVEVRLAPIAGGTRVTVVHTNIPEGQGVRYDGGWKEFYFLPMLKHFGTPAKKKAAPKKAAPKKAAPKKAAAKKAAPKKAAPKKAAPKKAAPKKAAPKKAAAKKAAPKKAAPKKR